MTRIEFVERYVAGERYFSGADLFMADLSGADLSGADLSSANLGGADLSLADLRGANLRGANLHRADLRKADLRGSDLSSADLRGANLDYSVWPLSCGSVGVTIDSNISRQLVYHALCNMPEEDKKEFLSDPFGYANSFHRAGECPAIIGKISIEVTE